ncbi:hypothetical protein [Myxococcus stipitatus]|uniref:hypothetical protein n=1 Tax=Myxococcus stipitatus TaxID=83455 RepID=UPI0030D01A6B
MALKRKGRHYVGDSREDIRESLARYSQENGYPVERMTDLRCPCGTEVLSLLMDEEAGAAVQTCTRCEEQVPLADSLEFLDDAELEESACVCGGTGFEVVEGVAFYSGSSDVRWYYLGCRCPACGVTGCYGDWKTP